MISHVVIKKLTQKNWYSKE